MRKDADYRPKGYDFMEKLYLVFVGVMLGIFIGRDVGLYVFFAVSIASYAVYLGYLFLSGQTYRSYLKEKSFVNLQELAVAAKQQKPAKKAKAQTTKAKRSNK